MTGDEYRKAKVALPKLRRVARDQKSLAEFLEALITVKGHAWCMVVKQFVSPSSPQSVRGILADSSEIRTAQNGEIDK